MLSVGKFPSGQQCNWAVLANPISKSFLFSSKTHKSPQKINHVRIVYVPVLKRSGLCIHATNGQSKGSDSVIEMGEFDEEEDDDDDEFLEDEDEDEDEDDEFIPLINMKEWLANKPTGFGEDKEYDTSIEDKLMEEIEQSRKAQLANINRLKHSPVNSKKDSAQLDKGKVGVLEATPEGFCVSLLNLPKKKNIHRELNAAFKGVPGILQIVPVVSGNKKTRDPICKGLAFVYFKTESEARRFVETFSGQSISFGKIQKQISCEMNLNSPKPRKKPSAENTANTALPLVRNSDIPKQTTSLRLGSDGKSRRSAKPVDDEERIEENQSLVLPEESKKAPKIKSPSLKLKKEPQEKAGKAEPKTKKKRSPKMNIPGSSNRLKIKDKTLLAGVFSKYMAKEGSSVEQEERACVSN